MDLNKLEKKIIAAWVIRRFIVTLFLIVPTVIAIIFAEEIRVALLLGLGIPVLLISLLVLFWPFVQYERYHYGYDEERISVSYGVIFKRRLIIPVRQIQDLQIYVGPVMSMLGLSGVVISTAGSNFVIDGISKEDAEAIVSDLESKLNKRLDGEENEKAI